MLTLLGISTLIFLVFVLLSLLGKFEWETEFSVFGKTVEVSFLEDATGVWITPEAEE